MGYAVTAFAVLGFAFGLFFRLKVLLPILALLLVSSLVFAFAHGITFISTLLIVVISQFIVQAGYFAGILVRAFFAQGKRMRPIL